MQTILERLQPLHSDMQQHPITTVAVIAAAFVVLAILASAVHKLIDRIRDRRSEGPHLKIKRVSRTRAIACVFWAGSPPERFLRYVRQQLDPIIKVKQKWPVLAMKVQTEMLWIFGGTGSGKSARILAWMIVIRLKQGVKSLGIFDPKGDLLDLLWPWLGRTSGSPRVHVISSLAKHRDAIVSAIDVCEDEATLALFLESLYSSQPSSEKIWEQGATNLILCTYRAAGKPDLPTLYDILKDTNRLDQLTEEQPEIMGSVWTPGATNGPHPSAHFNAISPLSALENPLVRRMFDRRRAQSMNGKLDWIEREIAFLCIAPEHLKIAAPLVAGIVGLWQHQAAYRPYGPPVELAVDEGGLAYPVRKVDDFLNLCRGAGVNVCLAAQDIAQIRNRMGKEAADSAIGAARATIVGPSGAEATQQWTSGQCGTTLVERRERQAQPGIWDQLNGAPHRPDVRRKQREPRVRDEHVRELDDDKGEFILVRGLRKSLLIGHEPVFGKWIWIMRPRKSRRGGIRLVQPTQEDSPQTPEDTPTQREDQPHSPPKPAAGSAPGHATDSAYQPPQAGPEPESPPTAGSRLKMPTTDDLELPSRPLPAAEMRAELLRQVCASLLRQAVLLIQIDHGLEVSFTEPVVADLVGRINDNPRQLPSLIESKVMDKVGAAVTAGHYDPGEAVTLTVKEAGRLSLRRNQ